MTLSTNDELTFTLPVLNITGNTIHTGQCEGTITKAILGAIFGIKHVITADKDPLVEFEFERVKVRVRGDSNPDLIYAQWWLTARGGLIGLNPKPDPKPRLIAELLKIAFSERICKCPEKYNDLPNIKYANPDCLDLWLEYTAAPEALKFAVDWANAMQDELKQGRQLADIVDNCSRKAGLEKIEKLGYDDALLMLCRTWNHGLALWMWYVENQHHRLDVTIR